MNKSDKTASFAALLITLYFSLPVLIIAWLPSCFQLPVIPVQQPIYVPDFSSYEDVNDKKQQFFSYFYPLILAENQQVLMHRQALLSHETDELLLREICQRYSRDCQVIDDHKRLALLVQVDIIPPALVLAQAAMESGWGTSRFARKGYNFFGQWCYQEDCGLVPLKRDKHAVHEVRLFDSPRLSVRSYLFNLNTHVRYSELREQRFLRRVQGDTVTGEDVVEFLLAYSQRGQAYVDELRVVMQYNQLIERYDLPYLQTLSPNQNLVSQDAALIPSNKTALMNTNP
ncbi:MAG: glucosaminidase domain-containing protein [Pseudomonadales bacterium]|nr:glucosaminidase domain-containing protein [Pseudomonadales bacterium]